MTIRSSCWLFNRLHTLSELTEYVLYRIWGVGTAGCNRYRTHSVFVSRKSEITLVQAQLILCRAVRKACKHRRRGSCWVHVFLLRELRKQGTWNWGYTIWILICTSCPLVQVFLLPSSSTFTGKNSFGGVIRILSLSCLLCMDSNSVGTSGLGRRVRLTFLLRSKLCYITAILSSTREQWIMSICFVAYFITFQAREVLCCGCRHLSYPQ